MRHTTRRAILVLSVCAALLCAPADTVVVGGAAEKAIKKDEARKLIAAASVLELNKEAVTIREISPPGAVATVLAGVKLGFRFATDGAGAWRVAEVRTGDRRWEPFDLLAGALGGEATAAAARAELDALAAELVALGRREGARDEGKRANGARESRPGDKDREPPSKEQTPEELRRGPLSVKNPAAAFAPIGRAVVVEVEVETSVDIARDSRGRWQVARARFGVAAMPP